jgi:hypothetical protein
MLTKRRLRIYRIIVRVTATIALVELVMAAIWPAYSYKTANGRLGTILGTWHISASLALPLSVGFEAWWARRLKAGFSRIWIEAALAAAYFALLWGGVFYVFTQYSLI